ncbi:MAG TPA: hypothetical protein VMW78_01945 [Anaerolineae bacterium]|nr:hypothetical protein [Anaerolineae bacterium]
MQEYPHCATCEFRGYSAYVCKLHHKKMTGKECDSRGSLKCIGKTVAVGAGAGIIASTVGMIAMLPAIGIKTLFAHLLAVKVGAGGGVAGAGVNLARKATEKDHAEKKKKRTRKRIVLF